MRYIKRDKSSLEKYLVCPDLLNVFLKKNFKRQILWISTIINKFVIFMVDVDVFTNISYSMITYNMSSFITTVCLESNNGIPLRVWTARRL